ncbi:hypothetical protein ABZ807_17555 [Micromonospora sp. NPDC047548]|uniref:hypothetical protein n=1 Tax=Micromonospora sp. NPDC047548 TaxID=3155624 RepID=UPI0033EF69BE
MTSPVRKLSISVPQDVAATLAEQPNASAYITQAVRDRRAVDQFRAEQARRGVQLTEEGMAEARARRRRVEAEWPAERYDAVRERVREHMQDDLVGGDRPASAA